MTKRSKFKWAITLISFFMTLVMFGAFIYGLTNPRSDSTDTVGTFDYSIGTIDSSGKMLESGKSIYTKDMYTVSGMDIQIDEDTSTVTYKVIFYDENKEFISMTDSLESDFDITTVPEIAKYFRVLITPYKVDGDDVKITLFNMNKYAKQLDITYNK